MARDIGNAQSDLIELFPMPEMNFGWYLLTRQGLKALPCVKAFNQFIVARARTLKRRQRRDT